MLKDHSTPQIVAKLCLWLTLPLFVACGGGGGSSPPPPPPPPPPVTSMGVFIDSPVVGLGYQSGAAAAGTTNAEGMFTYTVGDPLTFSIGGVQIGTLPDGKQLVTPYDFGAAAENIARLLQTLDADGNHLNGIDLSAAASALAGVTLDASAFTADATTFETTIQPILDTALGAGSVLVDAVTAIANLDAALDTTFEVSELAGQVLIVDVPSEGETGFVVFEPLADPGDDGSSVELFLLSDTILAGGNGSTTVLDWSVDGNGQLLLTDPVDASVITVEQVGASSGIRSIRLTQDTEELMGSFLTPANGVAMDLTGDDGRTFDAQVTTGTDRLTFYPGGILARISNGVVFQETWSLHESGSLLIIEGAATEVFLSVLVNGNLAAGGDTMSFSSFNLSGVPAPPVYELHEMILGAMVPVVFPDPSTAISYDFATDPGVSSSTDPVLASLFTGVTVSGTFRYANWVPAIITLDGPPLHGTAVYPDAMLDLAGSANGLAFSDAFGATVVGNDRYEPLGFVDFMSSGIGQSLDNGFDVDNYRLLRVRWFWIETDTTPDDFLDSDLLPETLPGIVGRLALDFALISDPQTEASVFFDGFTVTPTP